jgi:spore photoproduct lyase
VEKIRQADPDLCVYLCMEGDDIWKDSFGFSPEQRGGLTRMLDSAVEKRMKFALNSDT